MRLRAGTVGEYHGLTIGKQEHFARISELPRGNIQHTRFVVGDARQAAAHGLYGELCATLLDAPCQRAVVAHPERVSIVQVGQECGPVVSLHRVQSDVQVIMFVRHPSLQMRARRIGMVAQQFIRRVARLL
jgi:hypothetical protein